MVLLFTSTVTTPPTLLYMGKDKFENEVLLKYGDELDVWFHVDKLSSAHVYLRLQEDMKWEEIPKALLEDIGQLTKANSIEGNKKQTVTIIYTPWSNVKKTGDLATGAVQFHNDRIVRRHHIAAKDNAILNRLNKTKREETVDHEAVRQERERAKGRERKEVAVKERNAKLAEQRARQEAKASQDYSNLYSSEAISAAQREKERKARAKAQEEKEKITAGDDAERIGMREEQSEEEDAESEGSFM
ncbi:Predicted coiled-coil protein [Ceraceosorus bombacis]|uniref:Predicted coiled-coil protein n=1 Tax=Ceraceosorus bombacis TaxID=401625 RepID=A0A0P1BHC5_9BASI|nr:Predicted coiled-coil protein [Ceraceosorus bombacis]